VMQVRRGRTQGNSYLSSSSDLASKHLSLSPPPLVPIRLMPETQVPFLPFLYLCSHLKACKLCAYTKAH
jgi:hypothetical protein